MSLVTFVVVDADNRFLLIPGGAKLFVFGIPEDLGDKKLADLFTPFGTVIYAKVGVEKETGRNRTYGMSLSFPFVYSSLVLIAYSHISCWRFLMMSRIFSGR